MTADEIRAATEACEGATPGPWTWTRPCKQNGPQAEVWSADGDIVATCYGNLGLGDGCVSDDVARFIALSRTALPLALADAAKLKRVEEILSEKPPAEASEIWTSFQWTRWYQNKIDRAIEAAKGV